MIPLPAFHLVTTPSDARVRSLVATDTIVSPGDVVAVLDAPRGPLSLRATAHGRVGGALTAADQKVGAGEGIIWLHR
jgi:acetyl/propionyl-CoA carboxylase alpha subunit